MCDHDHDPDDFSPGSRYQVFFELANGFTLRSTPMMGEEARALIERDHKKYSCSGFKQLPIQEAVRQLETEAEDHEQSATTLEDHVTYHHAGFQHNADAHRVHAENLRRRAAFLKSLSE